MRSSRRIMPHPEMADSPASHTWQVPVDHPAFDGHFPGTPILPGVLLLDIVIDALTAARITTACREVRSAKFLSPARPGDTLAISHTLAPGGVIHFEIHAGTRKIAVGDIAAAVAGASGTSP